MMNGDEDLCIDWVPRMQLTCNTIHKIFRLLFLLVCSCTMHTTSWWTEFYFRFLSTLSSFPEQNRWFWCNTILTDLQLPWHQFYGLRSKARNTGPIKHADQALPTKVTHAQLTDTPTRRLPTRRLDISQTGQLAN